MFGHQDEPKDQSNDASAPSNDSAFSGAGFVTPSNQSDSGDSGTSDSSSLPDDLLGIKQQALQQLTPLVGHLEQSPEEKFRTTMMMIQASDNQDLIKNAYEAAQAIGDEKARAQALLDIVNEINYFTQHASK